MSKANVWKMAAPHVEHFTNFGSHGYARLSSRRYNAWLPIKLMPKGVVFSSLFMQVWLMLNNLLVDPKARAKYDMDEYRKETVLRVRRYMNDILLDQLPILKDLQRVLDELTMGVSSQQDESQTTRLIIEQVQSQHCKSSGTAHISLPNVVITHCAPRQRCASSAEPDGNSAAESRLLSLFTFTTTQTKHAAKVNPSAGALQGLHMQHHTSDRTCCKV